MLPSSLNSPAPQAVRDAARLNGIGTAATQAAWESHWIILPAQMAVEAHFRGYLSRAQCEAVLRAHGLAPEQHANYIDLQRPVIPARSAPAMVRAGVLDLGRAQQIMREQGYRPEDIELLIAYAGARAGDDDPEAASELSGLGRGTVTALYTDGAMEREQAIGMLRSLGMGGEAADLTLDMIDLREQAAERKAERDLLIAQARAGVIETTDAEARMFELGLTSAETARAVTALTREREARTKIPGVSTLTAMRKQMLIDDAEYLAHVERLGYSRLWAERFLALLASGGEPEEG